MVPGGAGDSRDCSAMKPSKRNGKAAEDYQLLAFISQPEPILRSGFLGQRAKCSAAPIRKSIPYPPFWRLVHRLAYNGDVAAGQLAVFQGASEAPLSEFMRVGRPPQKNSQPACGPEGCVENGLAAALLVG